MAASHFGTVNYAQWCRNEFESGGHRSGAKRRKNFLVVPLHFLALKAQLVALVSAFVMVSTVWSVSNCLLFFYSQCPPCPAICESGGHVLPCLMESTPLTVGLHGSTSTADDPSLFQLFGYRLTTSFLRTLNSPRYSRFV